LGRGKTLWQGGVYADFRDAWGMPAGASLRYVTAGGKLAVSPRPWLTLEGHVGFALRHISVDREASDTVRGLSAGFVSQVVFLRRAHWRAGVVARLRRERYETDATSPLDVAVGLRFAGLW
jgi:hypothetical protein